MVVSGSALLKIRTVIAEQLVIAESADQLVVAIAAFEEVVAGPAVERVVPEVAGDLVVEGVASAVDRAVQQSQPLDIEAERDGDRGQNAVVALVRELHHQVAGLIDDVGVAAIAAAQPVRASPNPFSVSSLEVPTRVSLAAVPVTMAMSALQAAATVRQARANGRRDDARAGIQSEDKPKISPRFGGPAISLPAMSPIAGRSCSLAAVSSV